MLNIINYKFYYTIIIVRSKFDNLYFIISCQTRSIVCIVS